ncbi:sigma-70 family RNA polymerase sigma factor [Sphaerisporangium sp. NPDC049002]|uniref:RNA polymerase sigma factor n=1 Tax=Sphaerisporangium sp. NPDC049002 TaxID=3155392 RepID=UPI0033F39BDF
MPGWPSVGRADDQRLLEALRRADGRAADGLYDAYADRLNDYAYSLLHDTDAAADSVHDALVTAHGRAGALREPARTRAWLYALTRFQCATRRGRTPANGTTPELFLEGDEEDPELAAIVREGLAEMGHKDRDVLLLALRHELTVSEIGAVLGLTSRQTGVRLTRARDHLENAAAALILARTGRAHCPDLSALLDSIEGPLPQQLRRRLTRHIIGCKECTEGRRRRVSAERLLDVIPVAFPPLSLRRRVAESCAKSERDAGRTAIMAVADRFDKNGFPPVGAERRSRSRESREDRRTPPETETPRYGTAVAHARRTSRRTPVFATVACVLVATGAMVVATGQGSPSPGGLTQTLRFPSQTPGELQISYGPEPTDASFTSEPPPPSASATPARRSPTRSAASAPAAPTGRPRPPSRTPRPTPTPAAKLVVSCPGALGEEGDGVILVSARNATLSWTASATGGLAVTPGQGVLKSGVKERLSVVVSQPGEAGEGTVTLRSVSGEASCRLSWDGQDPPPASDPPPDQSPTPDPSASGTPSEESSRGPA